MPAAIPIAALIAGGATIYAAKTAANAQQQGTAAQVGYENKALAAAQEAQTYQRGQYGDYVKRLEPYAAATAPSLDSLNQLLDPAMIGLPGSRPQPTRTPPVGAQGSGWPGAPATPPKPGQVQMKAPTGETDWVDAAMVPRYQALGAQVVQ